MLLAMYGCSWAYWFGSTVKRWIDLRVDPAQEEREAEPDGDPCPQRPDPAGEGAADEQRGDEAGHDREGVEGEELGGLVGVADAGREAPRAVDQLQLVQLVAGRHGQQVEAAEHAEVDADRRREAAAARRCQRGSARRRRRAPRRGARPTMAWTRRRNGSSNR